MFDTFRTAQNKNLTKTLSRVKLSVKNLKVL